MTTYPQHEKLRAIKDETQAAYEFIDWLQDQGIFLAQHVEGEYSPVGTSMRELLAQWKEIDLDALENEKQQMLVEIRKGNDGGNV